MKSIRFLLFMLSIGVIGATVHLSGCTSDQVTSAARVTLEAKLADILVQSGEPSAVVMTASLTDEEAHRIAAALDAYALIRMKWSGVTDNPQTLVSNLLGLSVDYATLVGEYQAVRQIVRTHWDEYTPAQQATLAQYHDRALVIHESVQTLLQNQRRFEATAAALEIGILIAKAAVL